MPVDIPESDWRRFREVHATLLERYCGRVLEEVAALSRDSQGSAHDLYLKLYQLIDTRNEELACAFDDFRRSTAIFQLSILRRMKLLTDEELSVFSEQNRMQVERIVSL